MNTDHRNTLVITRSEIVLGSVKEKERHTRHNHLNAGEADSSDDLGLSLEMTVRLGPEE